jgi:glycosyltransferase involved in cell wall biosynthesis
MASGVRTLELAKSLQKIGFEPIVFSPYERTHVRDCVKVVNVPTLFSTLKVESIAYYVSRRVYYSRTLQKLVIKVSKKLAAGGLSGSLKLEEVLKKFDVDIVQAEQDNAALLLLSIRQKLGLPIVLDLHGIWPEELLAAAAIRKDSKDWKDLQSLMEYVVNNVDLTVCLSEAMKEYVLSNYGVQSNKVVVVPPGGRVFLNSYNERPAPPKVVYAGIVSYRKHVDLFVRSMPYIMSRKPDVNFYITKRGDLLSQIQGLAENLKVNPVYFWFNDLQETLRFLFSCHMGVLPTTNDTSSRISMPSKLFDYLSAGLPVVANEVGGWTDIIKDNNVGKVTMDDPEDFARGILELLDSPEEMAESGRRGMELIQKVYNWDVSAKLIAENYKELSQHQK